MFKTFILLATIANPNADSYVIDYGLSESDCQAVFHDVMESDGFEIAPGIVAAPSQINLTCQEENAIPPCATEDSDFCFWNAQTRGNGRGDSFIAWDGQIFYMEF